MAATRIWMRSNGAWSYVECDNHARLHEASHISGGTDPFLSTDVLESISKRWQESGGPTTLTAGAVTDGQYLKRSGTTIIGGTVTAPSTVARTGDSSGVQNNTLAADDTLLFPVTSSATNVLFFHAFLLLNSVNVTMGAQFGWSVPASCTMSWGQGDIAGSSVNAGFEDLAVGSTAAQATAAGGTTAIASANNGLFMAHLAGFVFGGGTSGNVNLKWAQSVTNANNLVLKKGSFIEYRTLIA